MSGVVVKICGLREPSAVAAARDAGADMIGFVAFAPSPRHVTAQEAAVLGALVGTRARKALLTVDAEDALIDAMVAALRPDILQLHGRESPERAAALGRRFGVPVMKALAVAARGDLARAADYREAADWLLLDAAPPKDATRPGGNGRRFDWSLLDGFSPGLPWLLSGGLDAGNVAEALQVSGAPGVDTSSGVESAPGVKDCAKIAAFVRAARSARP